MAGTGETLTHTKVLLGGKRKQCCGASTPHTPLQPRVLYSKSA